jgi:putative permease
MTDIPRTSYKRIMGVTAVVMATLMVLYVLYRLNAVVLLFVLSIIVAAPLRKGVVWLGERRVPRGVAILIWYVVLLGIVGLGIFFLGGPLGDELQQIGQTFPQSYDRFVGQYQTSSTGWQQSIAQRLPTTDSVINSLGEGGATEIGFQIAGITSSIFNLLLSVIAVLTLTFYWLVDQDRFERLWLTLLPVQERAVARHAWRDIEFRVGAYVRSEAAQFALTITILWMAFNALGVAYPTMFALYAGVVQLIPWVGVLLALLPVLLMTLTSPWWLVLLTAAIILGLGIAMNYVVEPQLCGEAPVHPIISVVALMILGEASGIIGMLIALPLAATLQSVLSEIFRTNRTPRTLSASAESSQIDELQRRLEELRTRVPETGEDRHAIEGMLARLQELIQRTEMIAREHSTEAERTRMARTTPSIFQRRKAS